MDRPFDVVNHFDIYCVDRNFGPFFVKFCTYFPYNAKLCLNGHEYAKQQLANKGIGFKALDNVAAIAAASVQRRRPQGRLPLPGLDSVGGVLSHSGPGQARYGAGVFRGSHSRESRHRQTRSGAADLRPPRHGADAGQVSHAGDGVAPSLHVDYKNTRITQYHKEGRALRTETTINNTHGLVRLHTPIRSL